MPISNDDATTGFLKRWSDRKVAASGQDAVAKPDADMVMDETSKNAVPDDPDLGKPATRDAPDVAAEAAEVTEADLQNLDFQSDYTKFMRENVPEAIRRQALRQLWRSDPVLANVDGLCDYDDDYTDAALAVKVLKTAHKVGQGFLTDEEVAANQARGAPAADPDDAKDDDADDQREDEAMAVADSGTCEVDKDENGVQHAENAHETRDETANLTDGGAKTGTAESEKART